MANEPLTDSPWTELDRIQWIRDHLPPDTANTLIALISNDDDDG